MNANELRIGNWVNYDEDGTNFIVTEISETGIAVVNDEELTWIELGQFSGIPITEEWLLKFGFEIEKGSRAPDHFKFIKTYLRGHFYKRKGYFFNNTYCKIQYVHQLQNLYFALTGQELEFKNPTQ